MTSRPDPIRTYRRCRFRPVTLTLVCALTMIPLRTAPAQAAQVHGTFVAYEGGPQAGRSLHFQDEITRDCYMLRTAPDGSFATRLPPGVYDLRAERGAILARAVSVGTADVGLGTVSDLAPYAPSRLWDLQSIAPSILSSPAPSTAHLMTGPTVWSAMPAL